MFRTETPVRLVAFGDFCNSCENVNGDNGKYDFEFGESFRFLQLRRKIEINLNFERWPRQDSRVATEACAIFDGGQIVGENRQFVLENQQKIKDLSKDIKDSKEEPGVALG